MRKEKKRKGGRFMKKKAVFGFIAVIAAIGICNRLELPFGGC
jgi:hypothetical protein